MPVRGADAVMASDGTTVQTPAVEEDLAAGINAGVRHKAHQSDLSAAIDQADIVLSQFDAHRFRCAGVFSCGARIGAAIHTDGFFHTQGFNAVV